MSCKPCQRKRIEKIITDIKQLNAIEYSRKDGDLYIKTFLINDKRNNNGWRASWNSIRENVKSFIGRPGIEYTECNDHGCHLDHTNADTFDDNIHIQEKYRTSTIVDVVLDEATHTAYAVHKIEKEEFAQKIERKEIKYLSPSIWPNKERTTVYENPDNNEWYIDTTKWEGVHDAWVDSPAFGHEARIVGQCIGDDSCISNLKNNKMLVAVHKILLVAKSKN